MKGSSFYVAYIEKDAVQSQRSSIIYHIGGVSDDYGYSVFETSGGDLIITGYTSSSGAGGKDVYLIKTDNSGSVVWEKTLGGVSDDCGNSVYETSDGYYIITGYTNSAGAGGSDLYLIKTDNNGNLVWEKTFGGGNDDLGKAVIESSDGSYIVSGSTESFGEGGSDIYVIRTDTDGIEQ